MALRRPKHERQAFASGMLLGITLTGIGVVLAQTIVGPVLARSLSSTEEQILGNVHERLVEEYVLPLEPDKLMRTGVRAMIAGLEDHYSSFLGPEELATYREESSGKLIGIGVTITDEGRVQYPMPGGPGERAGLRPGDRILSVDGQSTGGLDVDAVAALIKGPAATSVHLEVLPYGKEEQLALDIAREAVPTGTVGRVEMLDPAHGIGRIHIRSFAETTPAELDAGLDALLEQGLRGLVLDVRFNRGGLLKAAVACAARFVEGGRICTLLGRDGQHEVRRAAPASFRDLGLPIAVLVNEHSASGSEVLAAALRDRGAAILVGCRSYGKGVFQQVQQYEDGAFLIKFTAGYYLTPSGRLIESQLHPDPPGGLEPDLHVPLLPYDQSRALAIALAQDEIPEPYREQAVAIFPGLAGFPIHPPDPATDAARQALAAALDGTVL